MFSSLFTDKWYVESSEEMSTADSDSDTESDSTYCLTPERGVDERCGPVQGTAGSTAILVYVPVLQPVKPPGGTVSYVCTKQPESADGVVSAFGISPIAMPNQVGFVQLSLVGVFVEAINTMADLGGVLRVPWNPPFCQGMPIVHTINTANLIFQQANRCST